MAITFAIRWTWVLGIALFLPVALPAGGGEFSQPKVSSFEGSIPFFASNCCELLATPFKFAPRLRSLEVGTPLRVLRSWHGSDGQEWLQVQISTNAIIRFSSLARRGWINV